MSNEEAKLIYKEELLVEDWVGDDSDERQAKGEPPDSSKTITTWYEGETEITDPDRILELESRISQRK